MDGLGWTGRVGIRRLDHADGPDRGGHVAVTARYPKPIYDFVLGMNRWVFRVAAYALLMTDRYPPFRLDMGGQEPASEPVAATARSAGGAPLSSWGQRPQALPPTTAGGALWSRGG